MELHLHSHRWVARQPDWAAAAVAGFGAGGILMVMELLWEAMVAGRDPWLTSRMIAALVMGWGVLQSSGYDLAVLVAALAVHYVLGIAFAVLLAGIIAPFHLDSSAGMVLLTGAIFGAVLYLFNFYVMASAFTWFADLRGWPTMAGHVLFGVAAAYIYNVMERRNPD